MVWTVIPNSDVDPDSPITTGLMTALRDNVAAALNQDSGAPAPGADFISAASQVATGIIGQSELGANSVGQSEVKTAYQEVTATGGTEFTATGGIYCIGHTMQGFFSDINHIQHRYASNTTTYAARWYWYAGSGTYDSCRIYYINSSPPYDLGDGEVPMFAFAIMDNATGLIEASSLSVDPTWAYNGKTNITPSRYGKDGKVYRSRKDMSHVPFTYREALLDPVKLEEYSSAFNSAKTIEEEITQALKNADMNDMPHPWVGNDLTGKTVVLVDPMSPIMQVLLEAQGHDDGDMGEIFNNKYVKIGNTSMKRSGPNGLLIPSIEWKNTK